MKNVTLSIIFSFLLISCMYNSKDVIDHVVENKDIAWCLELPDYTWMWSIEFYRSQCTVRYLHEETVCSPDNSIKIDKKDLEKISPIEYIRNTCRIMQLRHWDYSKCKTKDLRNKITLHGFCMWYVENMADRNYQIIQEKQCGTWEDKSECLTVYLGKVDDGMPLTPMGCRFLKKNELDEAQSCITTTGKIIPADFQWNY